MPKKPKHRSPTPEVFQVEVITAARVSSEGEWEYRVKWAGYTEADNSWEPHENVQECDRLLKSFWNHIGIDNEDYPLGYQVHAQKYWIENEKEFFAKEFSQQAKQKKDMQAEKEKKKGGAQNKAKSWKKPVAPTGGSANLSANAKGKARETTNSLMADLFADDKAVLQARTTIKIPKRPRVVLSDSDSQDSQPLRKTLKTTSSGSNVDKNVEEPPPSPTSLFSQDSSPAAPTKTSSKPPPKVKVINLEPRNVANGSALSTKQRIFQNTPSGSSTKPKLPPVIPRKGSLANLGFKKMPNPSRTSSGSREMKPPQDPAFTEFSSSPVSYDHIQDDFPSFDPHQQPRRDVPSPEARLYSSPPPLSREPPSLVDHVSAEEFLNQILPPAPEIPMHISEPMPEPMSDDPVVPQSLIFPRPIPAGLPKIPKKWKWSGELFMNTTSDYAEKICTVTLTDTTDAPQSGQGFSIYFSLMDSIRFTRLINTGDLSAILPSCGPVQQLAKLKPENSSDEDAFGSLVTFMDKNRQIAVIPLSADNAEVASLVVFPATLQSVCRRLKVPSYMQQKGIFVAALIPWSMRPKDYSTYDVQSSQKTFAPPEFKRSTSHALQLLEFPRDLKAYMSQPGRTYCVWWSPGDGTTATPGLETNQLHAIMKSCKAKNVGHKADVRVVFVHVGALVTLHRFPALAERRSKRPEIHFYTYGTHANVPPEQWGVNAIYPLGGIITFTPEALLEDPTGIAQLIRQTAEHPFWDCYLLPSVIGMAARRSCADTDPLSVYKTGDFVLHDIVTLIAQGQVSLLQAPPVHGHDPQLGWVSSQLKLLSLGAPGTLEMCLSAFSAQYSNTPIAQLSGTVEAEISKDLLRMQTQPSIMEDYRRFVIITTSAGPADSNKDGFEWITLNKFDFKDKFFEKSDQPTST